MTLVINEAQLHSMACHAQDSYPEECLGLLLGTSTGEERRLLEVFPLPNSAASAREVRVECHPLDYLRGEKRALALQAEVCGFYHSHPKHPAVPSRTDLQGAAYNGWSYLVLSPQTNDARSWTLRADRTGFEEEPIVITGDIHA